MMKGCLSGLIFGAPKVSREVRGGSQKPPFRGRSGDGLGPRGGRGRGREGGARGGLGRGCGGKVAQIQCGSRLSRRARGWGLGLDGGRRTPLFRF